ncbi:MAG: alpha-L-arabinofuranosidase C-terminal domain-containing protein [Fimbriimonadales bacterium]|nr:MAG: hypothetical protein KatS3mg018_0754 [Fimbriimonadales bacterium]
MVWSVLLMAQMATQDFVDNFEGRSLQTRWEWRAPVAGPTYALADGSLTVEVPARRGGYNHWAGVADAPMLRTPCPVGDWAMEATLQLLNTPPDAEFHAGLAVGFSENRLILWGPFQSRRFAGKPTPELWLERTGEARLATAPLNAPRVELRVAKQGGRYTFFTRARDADGWQAVSTLYSLIPPRFVGIVGKTFAEGESQPIRFAVERFALQTLPASPAGQEAVIRIDARAPEATVSPLLFGHFIEHMGQCIQGGLWAELLTNRKFAGEVLPDGAIEGWRKIGDARLRGEHRIVYTGGQAQRIEVQGARGGVAQAGIPVQAGRAYQARVVVYPEGVSAVQVSFGDATHRWEGLQAGQWHTLTAELTPARGEPAGAFRIEAEGQGALIVGCASLMPADNLHGWRRDVVETLRQTPIPILRWPGGNFVSGYDWREGVGVRDQRPPRWNRAWGGWEMNDVGTDEFIQLCRLINAEPYICLNAGEGAPRMAQEWVEYCNGGADTPMGRLRAENGHPEPYRVRYWGTGNEMYGDWQLGRLDAVKYALKANELARAIRAVDPDALRIAVGVDADEWGQWNRKVLRVAGENHEYLSVHFYQGCPHPKDSPEAYETVVLGAKRVEWILRRTAEIIREEMPDNPPLIAFDEWNTWYPEANGESQYRQVAPLYDGIFAAGVFHALIRNAETVGMANLAQLVNVLPALLVSPTQVVETPTWLAFRMYAPYFAGQRLRVSLPESLEEQVDAVAVRIGERIHIGLINYSLTETVRVRIEIAGATLQQTELIRLHAEPFHAMNTFEQPNRVQLQRELQRWQTEWELPPHSVTVMLGL